jgi:hypothetical protein
MASLKLLILLMELIFLVFSPNPFCSTICKNWGCNGNTKNDCNNQCNTNWTPSSSTCIVNTAASNVMVDNSSDLDPLGSITFTPGSPTPLGICSS